MCVEVRQVKMELDLGRVGQKERVGLHYCCFNSFNGYPVCLAVYSLGVCLSI